MNRWTPCKRRNFIQKLKKIGFNGPYSGTKHQYMTFNEHRLAIPSNSEYSTGQLRMMLREVEAIIEREILFDEWNRLD